MRRNPNQNEKLCFLSPFNPIMKWILLTRVINPNGDRRDGCEGVWMLGCPRLSFNSFNTGAEQPIPTKPREQISSERGLNSDPPSIKKTPTIIVKLSKRR